MTGSTHPSSVPCPTLRRPVRSLSSLSVSLADDTDTSCSLPLPFCSRVRAVPSGIPFPPRTSSSSGPNMIDQRSDQRPRTPTKPAVIHPSSGFRFRCRGATRRPCGRLVRLRRRCSSKLLFPDVPAVPLEFTLFGVPAMAVVGYPVGRRINCARGALDGPASTLSARSVSGSGSRTGTVEASTASGTTAFPRGRCGEPLLKPGAGVDPLRGTLRAVEAELLPPFHLSKRYRSSVEIEFMATDLDRCPQLTILDDQPDGQLRDDYSYGEPLTTTTGNRAYYFNYGDLHFVNKPNRKLTKGLRSAGLQDHSRQSRR